MEKHNMCENWLRMQTEKCEALQKDCKVRDDVRVIPFLPFEKRQLTDEETRRQNLNNGDNYC